jgi:hypothetical protein
VLGLCLDSQTTLDEDLAPFISLLRFAVAPLSDGQERHA